MSCSEVPALLHGVAKFPLPLQLCFRRSLNSRRVQETFAFEWGGPPFLLLHCLLADARKSRQHCTASDMVASSIGIMQHPLLQRCRVGCPFAACAPRTNIRHLRPLSCRSTEDSRQCAATSEISGKPVTRSLQKEGVEAAACQREPFRIKQAWPLAMFFGLIQPPASLAEQHSGLFAIAGEQGWAFSSRNSKSCMQNPPLCHQYGL